MRSSILMRLRYVTCFLTLVTIFGTLHAKTHSPLMFSPLNDESFAESITTLIHGEDESFTLVQAMLTNAGIGDEKGSCRVLHAPAKGKAIQEINRDPSDWQYHARTQTLQLSTCTFTLKGSVLSIKADTDSISLQATIRNVTSPSTPPGGKVNLKDDSFVHAEIWVPSAPANLIIQSGKSLSLIHI